MKKVYVAVVLLVLTAFLAGCRRQYLDIPQEPELSDTETKDTTVVKETTAPRETETTGWVPLEYLWRNSVRCIVDTDGGYGLYNYYTNELIGVYSDFRIMNRFDKNGEVEEVCYLLYGGDGKGELYELVENKLILQKEITGSIAFYGDYMVIDGWLYNSGMTEMLKVTGTPLESSPTLKDPITFSESDIRIVYVENDADKWLTDKRMAEEINGSSLSTVLDYYDRYNCLNRDSSGFYACSYKAYLTEATGNGFYVCERKYPVNMQLLNDFYNVYQLDGGTSWITTKEDEVLQGINGTICQNDEFLVYFPSNLQLPKAILAQDGEVLLKNVSNFAEEEDGFFVSAYVHYGDSAEAPEDNEILGFLDRSGNFTEYGRYERIYDVTNFGAVVRINDTLVLISSNGETVHTFAELKKDTYYLYVCSEISEDGKTATLVFEENYPSEKTSKDLYFYYDIP